MDAGEGAYSTFISYRGHSEKVHAQLLHEVPPPPFPYICFRYTKYMSLKCEPVSEPLQFSVKDPRRKSTHSCFTRFPDIVIEVKRGHSDLNRCLLTCHRNLVPRPLGESPCPTAPRGSPSPFVHAVARPTEILDLKSVSLKAETGTRNPGPETCNPQPDEFLHLGPRTLGESPRPAAS